MKQAKVCVVGSVNMDLVFRASRLPAPGETLQGQSFHTIPGGKGANQAVAAARQGAQVHFIAAVGDDDFGRFSRHHLSAEGINLEACRTIANTATGVAGIIVDEKGENAIVLAAGANQFVSPDDIHAQRATLQHADILLCQLETPLTTVATALQEARALGVKTVLNPAPAQALDASILSNVDFLILNETEIGQLSGLEIDLKEVASVQRACKKVRDMNQGAGVILVTLGSAGVMVYENDQHSWQQTAFAVNVTDTTAAGDTFAGNFAVEIALGANLAQAVQRAQAAAAIAVTRLGAQTSIPTREEVDLFLAQHGV